MDGGQSSSTKMRGEQRGEEEEDNEEEEEKLKLGVNSTQLALYLVKHM